MIPEALLRTARPVLVLLAMLWAVELVNQVLGHRLSLWLELEPRDLGGSCRRAGHAVPEGGFGQ